MTTITPEDTLQIQEISVSGYEKVYKVENSSVGLLGIICLHDTTLGPALGGIRIFPYNDFTEALVDVKRLAEAMTYKAAMANCSLGGGKSVIIANANQKTEELLVSFSLAIEKLGGVYIGAEDVGSSPKDILTMSRNTKYVTGLPHEKSSGNPSGFTAWGVYKGIQASLQKVYGSPSVRGKVIAIQGVGSVGAFLADMLFWNGAKLIVTDVTMERAKELARKYGATYCHPEEIYSVRCDLFAPCALGGVLNPETIPQLKCRIVAGAANNQLLTEADGQALLERGILYAPDFVINAGGLINVADELMPDGYSPERSREKIESIYDTLLMIYKMAEQNQCSTHEAATKIAKGRVANRVGVRTEPLFFHHSLQC